MSVTIFQRSMSDAEMHIDCVSSRHLIENFRQRQAINEQLLAGPREAIVNRSITVLDTTTGT
jgi:hypothetical protein